MSLEGNQSATGVRPKRPWLTLFVLTLAYALAYVDRQVLTLLAEPIRQTFHLTDSQIGLLQGFAFAVCFAIGGLPLGWLVDNLSRIRVASGCVALWSVATGSTGLASGFTQLLAARSTTALVEAGCSPAALSIFADIFPPRLLPRATAMYMTAPYIGGGLALLLGSMLLYYFQHFGILLKVGLSTILPWQSVFISLSIPGFILSIVLWFGITEPERHNLGESVSERTSLKETLNFLWHESRYLPYYFAAYAFILAALFSILTWYPALVIRSSLGEASTIGRPLGLIFLGCGIIGTLSTQRLIGPSREDGIVPRMLKLAAVLVSVQALMSIAFFWPLERVSALIIYAVLIVNSSLLTSMMPIPLQIGVPNRMRGRVIGIFMLCVNLVGSSIGPAAVGFMSDSLSSSPHSLSISLATVVIACSAMSFITILFAYGRAKIVANLNISNRIGKSPVYED